MLYEIILIISFNISIFNNNQLNRNNFFSNILVHETLKLKICFLKLNFN